MKPPPPPSRAAASTLPTAIGRFEVRAFLDEGAFGVVYRVFDPQLQREAALKVARPGTLHNPRQIERFLREARAAASLHHPHIVPVFDAGCDQGQHYIASSFIDGQTLAQYLATQRPDFAQTARIVRGLAEALAYAHQLDIVHRDVKPANVLLDQQGDPYLLDFGLAHRQQETEKLTHDGDLLGTPAYMAPEQALGQTGNPLPASDQYSLGVILYEMLCGRPPFSGPPETVLPLVINATPLRPADSIAGCRSTWKRSASRHSPSVPRTGIPPVRPWPTTCAASWMENQSAPAGWG